MTCEAGRASASFVAHDYYQVPGIVSRRCEYIYIYTVAGTILWQVQCAWGCA